MDHRLDIQPIDATFGAVVGNCDVARLDDRQWCDLYQAWLNHALLVFPGLHLSLPEQEAFATGFGRVENGSFPISNVRPDGGLRTEAADASWLDMLRGNEHWHHDATFLAIQNKGAVFSAEVTPPAGGQTGWADMRAAYDALEPSQRDKVETLSAHHSIHYSQARRGFSHDDANYTVGEPLDPLRPLVKTHPETGRKSLLIGRHAHAIPGMSEAESEAFLDELSAFACQPPRIYFHDWAPGDLVVWDNRCLMHCVKPWDMAEPRVMWHTGLTGDPVSEAALA